MCSIIVRRSWRGRERLEVEPQVFDLLVYLVENRDRVVSKDDLIEATSGRAGWCRNRP